MNNYKVIEPAYGLISSDELESMFYEGWELVAIDDYGPRRKRYIFKRVQEANAPSVHGAAIVKGLCLIGLDQDENLTLYNANTKWFGCGWIDKDDKPWRLPGRWSNRDNALRNLHEYADALSVPVLNTEITLKRGDILSGRG